MLLDLIPSFYRSTISVLNQVGKIGKNTPSHAKKGEGNGSYILGAWDLNFSHGP